MPQSPGPEISEINSLDWYPPDELDSLRFIAEELTQNAVVNPKDGLNYHTVCPICNSRYALRTNKVTYEGKAYKRRYFRCKGCNPPSSELSCRQMRQTNPSLFAPTHPSSSLAPPANAPARPSGDNEQTNATAEAKESTTTESPADDESKFTEKESGNTINGAETSTESTNVQKPDPPAATHSNSSSIPESSGESPKSTENPKMTTKASTNLAKGNPTQGTATIESIATEPANEAASGAGPAKNKEENTVGTSKQNATSPAGAATETANAQSSEDILPVVNATKTTNVDSSEIQPETRGGEPANRDKATSAVPGPTETSTTNAKDTLLNIAANFDPPLAEFSHRITPTNESPKKETRKVPGDEHTEGGVDKNAALVDSLVNDRGQGPGAETASTFETDAITASDAKESVSKEGSSTAMEDGKSALPEPSPPDELHSLDSVNTSAEAVASKPSMANNTNNTDDAASTPSPDELSAPMLAPTLLHASTDGGRESLPSSVETTKNNPAESPAQSMTDSPKCSPALQVAAEVQGSAHGTSGIQSDADMATSDSSKAHTATDSPCSTNTDENTTSKAETHVVQNASPHSNATPSENINLELQIPQTSSIRSNDDEVDVSSSEEYAKNLESITKALEEMKSNLGKMQSRHDEIKRLQTLVKAQKNTIEDLTMKVEDGMNAVKGLQQENFSLKEEKEALRGSIKRVAELGEKLTQGKYPSSYFWRCPANVCLQNLQMRNVTLYRLPCLGIQI